MKKLLFAVCALAAISLLAPNAGFAQAWENRIGMYSAPNAFDAATHAYASPALATPTSIYLVLTSPMLNGAPVATIDGFECTMTWTPNETGLFYLSNVFPVSAIDIDGQNWGYAVGFASPLTVTNNQVLLATITVMLTSPGATYDMFLHPAVTPGLPGVMAANVPDGLGGATLIPCTPSSGSFDDGAADFSLGGTTVGIETSTFGGVKALFR